MAGLYRAIWKTLPNGSLPPAPAWSPTSGLRRSARGVRELCRAMAGL